MAMSLLIGIEPPKEVVEKTLGVQRFVATRLDRPIYSPVPHIKIFVNSFSNFNEVEKKVVDIAKITRPFALKIAGLHTFSDDPLFKGTETIVYKLDKAPQLSSLQKQIFNAIAPLRTEDQEKSLKSIGSKYSPEQLENLRKYGYPYSHENWIFHSSITSVPKENYQEVWKKAQEFDSDKKWAVDSIAISLATDKGWEVIRRYRLGK